MGTTFERLLARNAIRVTVSWKLCTFLIRKKGDRKGREGYRETNRNRKGNSDEMGEREGEEKE